MAVFPIDARPNRDGRWLAWVVAAAALVIGAASLTLTYRDRHEQLNRYVEQVHEARAILDITGEGEDTPVFALARGYERAAANLRQIDPPSSHAEFHAALLEMYDTCALAYSLLDSIGYNPLGGLLMAGSAADRIGECSAARNRIDLDRMRLRY